MRKSFLLISIFVFSVLILSCSKEKEHYSCDAELDYNYSRPAYIALKPISKFKIWEVKLNDMSKHPESNSYQFLPKIMQSIYNLPLPLFTRFLYSINIL